MARHNFAFLYGQLLHDPKIMKDGEGHYKRGMCTLTVIRGIRDSGDKIKEIKYDHPVVLTRNVELIKEMETWKRHDMVEIKGTVTTKEIKKSTTCKECGQKNTIDGNLVYINPIYLAKRETNVSEEEGLRLLKQRCEISNQVLLIGSLCRDPERYKQEKKICVTQYQLAINRSYRIKEDPQDVKTDYPWIKSYGKVAENDAKALHTGSLVLVDGMIQTREIQRDTTCSNPECKCKYKWQDSALEIVPYKTEYLQNFNSFEDLEKMEKELDKKAASEVLD